MVCGTVILHVVLLGYITFINITEHNYLKKRSREICEFILDEINGQCIYLRKNGTVYV
jgi:hypothetical protein